MKIGFSLSPGGLLLPYHLGALDALTFCKVLTDESPLVGSSAGAIAVGIHGCGVSSEQALESTIDISDRCMAMGGARGRLLPLLREKLLDDIGPEQLERIRQREGVTGIAYKQIFPSVKTFLQTEFEDEEDLVRAICHSSMFPFFSTNLPFAIDFSSSFPRLMVDGFFTVPRERFGCPDMKALGIETDRTVTISPFPQAKIGLNASLPEDCISPSVKDSNDDGSESQMSNLFRLATQASSRKELVAVYESGWTDAENWIKTQNMELN